MTVLSFIGGVMVSVLASIVVDRVFEPNQIKPIAIKLVLAASSLITQY